jgi:ERCC4-type nuclease
MTVGADKGVVLIDDRAGSRDLIKFPPLNSTGELCRLDSADVAIPGNGPNGPVVIGIELKSISDLLSSTDRGRLQATQIPDMIGTYDINWILYYGITRPSPDGASLQILRARYKNEQGKWKWRSATSFDICASLPLYWGNYQVGGRDVNYGYLESLILAITDMGFRVKQVSGVQEAAAWIGVVSRRYSKSWEKHRVMRTLDHSGQVALPPELDRGVKQRIRFAETLPGIRFERAVEAAKHFTSVREMANAPAEEWQKVPKIGKIIAQSVVEAVS